MASLIVSDHHIKIYENVRYYLILDAVTQILVFLSPKIWDLTKILRASENSDINLRSCSQVPEYHIVNKRNRRNFTETHRNFTGKHRNFTGIPCNYLNDLPRRVILQIYRDNRFARLFDGMRRDGYPTSFGALNEIMEVIQHKYKSMSFRNTIESWIRHSYHMPLVQECITFLQWYYHRPKSVVPSNEKEQGKESDSFGTMSDPLNNKRKSMIQKKSHRTSTRQECGDKEKGAIYEHAAGALR